MLHTGLYVAIIKAMLLVTLFYCLTSRVEDQQRSEKPLTPFITTPQTQTRLSTTRAFAVSLRSPLVPESVLLCQGMFVVCSCN